MDKKERAINILKGMLNREKKRLILDQLEYTHEHENNCVALQMAIDALEKE